MKLTQKLLGYLNRVFDKGPDEVLAFRLRYAGTGMQWTVADATLTLTATGGAAPGVIVLDLRTFTLASLATYLGTLTGYSIEYQDGTTVMQRSAVALIDDSGDQNQSNGDHFRAFTSLLWAYMDAQAESLTAAREASAEALLQMSAVTASDEWVDEHGLYYNVPRTSGETDAVYVARMISEVIRARGNNVAIADSIERAIGGSAWATVRVTDYAVQTTAGDGTKSYGLFDIDADVDIDSPLSSAEIDANLRATLEAMRDAGTHLRTLKYIRTTQLRTYVGGFVKAGHDVTVSFGDGSSRLDGTWNLDGTRTLGGIWSGNTILRYDGSWTYNGTYTYDGDKL